MAETLDEKELQTLDKEGLKFSKELKEGINIYLVKLPHPEGITEVYFVAVLEKGQNVRYFTLEHTVAELCEGGAAAVIGEWTKDREHLNYGCGPQPEKETFVRTVVAFVRPQGQDN